MYVGVKHNTQYKLDEGIGFMSTRMIERGGFHQIDATVSVPTAPALLREVIPRDTLRKIADSIGEAELVKLS